MNRRLVARGLAVPAAFASVSLLVLAFAGAGWALLTLFAGLGALVAIDLHHQQRAFDWAAGPVDGPVPEGIGSWEMVFAAIRRRSRMRSASERDLARTIERFRKAAEAIPDAMVLLDPADRVRWANPRARTFLGLDYPGDVRQPVTHFMRQPEAVRYLRAVDPGEPLIVASQRDPELMLSIQIVPFGGEERLLIARDVSRLEAVERVRRDFIANVSHELKTPLTVVSGFVETMQDIDLEAPQRERYLSLMAQQTTSMQRLVDDLLTLSALESEQNALQEMTFPIEALVRELAGEAHELSRGEHAIAASVQPSFAVLGSRHELRSAFSNLVSNAVRYTAAGGSVALEWRVDGDGSGVFAVTDTGLGIAPEHVPRLTERFYRVDRSRSRATGGTGLGLAIVKHVLLRHQAVLEVDSVVGVGSTFRVRLPASRVGVIARANAGPTLADA